MLLIGELIALTTVLCWTISVQFFEAASKRIGALAVNIIRIACALTLFGALLFFRDGRIFPFDFPVHAWTYLALSGIIGFFMGDMFLFNALVALGPRLTLLIFSLSAPAAAVIGWLFFEGDLHVGTMGWNVCHPVWRSHGYLRKKRVPAFG